MISRSDILRGIATRFLPAAVAGSAAIALLLSTIGRWAPLPTQLLIGVVGASTLSAIGAGVALLAVRPRLRDDADVAGRRSLVAGGLASALSLAVISATSGTLSVILALPFIGGRLDLLAMPASDALPFIGIPVLSGALVAIGTYFPWVTKASRASAVLATETPSALPLGDAIRQTTVARPRALEALPNEELKPTAPPKQFG